MTAKRTSEARDAKIKDLLDSSFDRPDVCVLCQQGQHVTLDGEAQCLCWTCHCDAAVVPQEVRR